MNSGQNYEYWFAKWCEYLNMPYAEQEAITPEELSFSTNLSLQDYCGHFGLDPLDVCAQAQYGGFLRCVRERKHLYPYERAYIERQLRRASLKKEAEAKAMGVEA